MAPESPWRVPWPVPLASRACCFCVGALVGPGRSRSCPPWPCPAPAPFCDEAPAERLWGPGAHLAPNTSLVQELHEQRASGPGSPVRGQTPTFPPWALSPPRKQTGSMSRSHSVREPAFAMREWPTGVSPTAAWEGAGRGPRHVSRLDVTRGPGRAVSAPPPQLPRVPHPHAARPSPVRGALTGPQRAAFTPISVTARSGEATTAVAAASCSSARRPTSPSRAPRCSAERPATPRVSPQAAG